MFTSRISRALILTAGVGITTGAVLVTAQIPEVPVPTPSLLASDPNSKFLSDAFKLSTSLPITTIHAYASAFERCFLFRLERYILFLCNFVEKGRTLSQPLPLPGRKARFELGQPVSAAWTVTGINDEEVIMTYDHSLGTGATWLQIKEEDGRAVLLFGSSLDSRKSGRDVSTLSVVVGLHRLYSRLLLLNAAAQLWWNS